MPVAGHMQEMSLTYRFSHHMIPTHLSCAQEMCQTHQISCVQEMCLKCDLSCFPILSFKPESVYTGNVLETSCVLAQCLRLIRSIYSELYIYLWSVNVSCIIKLQYVWATRIIWLLLSNLWDRAPKDWHRRHSLFKGVFPIPQRKPSKEMGQLNRKITGVTCRARTSGCPNTCQVPGRYCCIYV